jgi:hypothetical protein
MTGARTIAFIAAIAIAALTLCPGVGAAATQDGASVGAAFSQDQKSNVHADASGRALDTSRPEHSETLTARDRAQGGAVRD